VKTLAKEHGFVQATQTAGVWSLDDVSQGWEVVNPAGLFTSSTYFDLAGMSQREKTLFFEGATVQEMIAPLLFNGAPGDSIILVDLMSTKPLTPTQLTSFPVYGNFAAPGASLTFEETVYARVNQYVVDLDTAAWGYMIQAGSNQVGSLKATASDRIYSYRILSLGLPFTGDTIALTGCRHLLQADAKEEAEFQYLMRLRRSYELAQNHDED